MRRRLLLTGASGGLGQRLIPKLRRGDWTIRAMIHRAPVSAADETAAGDLTEPESISSALSDVDAVMHLAAVTHARRAATYERVNAGGTEALVRAAVDHGVEAFVFVSTRANSHDGGAYSRSKRDAEEIVMRSGLDHVVIRLPEVYGLGGEEGVDAIIESARSGSPILIPGDGSQELAPLHIDDVVDTLASALEQPPGSREYTLCGERMTISHFAQRCVSAFGSRSRIVHVPDAAVRAASLAAKIAPLPVYPDQLARLRAPKAPCTPDAERELGIYLRTIDEGLGSLPRHG